MIFTEAGLWGHFHVLILFNLNNALQLLNLQRMHVLCPEKYYRQFQNYHWRFQYFLVPGMGRLLVNLVPMLKQKKKKKKKKLKKKIKKNMRKGTFFKLGSAQRCRRLGSENGILVGKSRFSQI